MRPVILLILLLGFTLAACSASPDLHPRPMCPPLADWTQEDSDALADEVTLYAEAAPLMTRATGELYVLRRQCGRE